MTKNQLYFLIIVFITFFTACKQQRSEKRDVSVYVLSDSEKALLQEGDIILRHGQGFVSNMIVKSLKEELPLSHVGIITRQESGKLMVVHSVSRSVSDYDGVQMEDLDRFVRESLANSLVVVRYKALDQVQEGPQLLSRRAHYYLKQRVPFDHSFDFDDDSRFFCTELVGRVFEDVFGDDILMLSFSGRGMLDRLKFEAFFNPQVFEVILNHHP